MSQTPPQLVSPSTPTRVNKKQHSVPSPPSSIVSGSPPSKHIAKAARADTSHTSPAAGSITATTHQGGLGGTMQVPITTQPQQPPLRTTSSGLLPPSHFTATNPPPQQTHQQPPHSQQQTQPHHPPPQSNQPQQVAQHAPPSQQQSSNPNAAAASSAATSTANASSASSAASMKQGMTPTQRRQLRQLQNLESIASFAGTNQQDCRSVYSLIGKETRERIQQQFEFATNKPILFKYPLYEPNNQAPNYFDIYQDIPASTWIMPPPPGFYLPKELQLGMNCREVREFKAARAAVLAAEAAAGKSTAQATNPAPSSTEDTPMTTASSSTAAATSSSTTSSTPPYQQSVTEWCLDKLLDQDLQESMESQHVLNSWDEGSHLSVIKTPGDGNCLLHAVVTAVYGFPDDRASVRDALYWELSSDAHKPAYLERFLVEQAREIGSARVLDQHQQQQHHQQPSRHPIGIPKPFIAEFDAADRANLTKEFNEAVERLPNSKNYLDSIHVFALANLFKRPIIVYGTPFLGANSSTTPSEGNAMDQTATAAQSTTTTSSPPTSSNASSISPSQQPNTMVGLYLPILFPDQVKLHDATAADRNFFLKPICLLYSCGKQGEQGHFSALVPTHGMMPEPTLVPLQQWGELHTATSPSNSTSPSPSNPINNFSSSKISTTYPKFGFPPLSLLPVHFLLQNEIELTMYYIHKYFDVQITCQGHYYAKQMLNRTQHYLKNGWENYVNAATILFSGQGVLTDLDISPDVPMTNETTGGGVEISATDPHSPYSPTSGAPVSGTSTDSYDDEVDYDPATDVLDEIAATHQQQSDQMSLTPMKFLHSLTRETASDVARLMQVAQKNPNTALLVLEYARVDARHDFEEGVAIYNSIPPSQQAFRAQLHPLLLSLRDLVDLWTNYEQHVRRLYPTISPGNFDRNQLDHFVRFAQQMNMNQYGELKQIIQKLKTTNKKQPTTQQPQQQQQQQTTQPPATTTGQTKQQVSGGGGGGGGAGPSGVSGVGPHPAQPPTKSHSLPVVTGQPVTHLIPVQPPTQHPIQYAIPIHPPNVQPHQSPSPGVVVVGGSDGGSGGHLYDDDMGDVDNLSDDDDDEELDGDEEGDDKQLMKAIQLSLKDHQEPNE